jgi:hypothetical protein
MYTVQQLQALRDALASGARLVRFGDRSIEYRSIEELERAIATAEAELGINNGTPPVRQIRVHTSKGF